MSASAQEMDTGLLAERERWHRESAAGAVAGSAALAAVFAASAWGRAPAASLAAWLVPLAAALAVWLGIAAAHHRALRSAQAPGRWLGRYRAVQAGHGLAWALTGLLILPGADAELAALVALACLAITVGALLWAWFDLVTAGLFIGAALVPAAGPLLRHLAAASPAAVALGLLLVVMAWQQAWRGRRTLRETVRLRLLEAAAAQAATTGQHPAPGALHTGAAISDAISDSISEMVSVIDENLEYRMVNEAWCRATGIAREAALGRKVFDVMPQAENAQRRQALRECLEQQRRRVVRDQVRMPGMPARHVETTFYPYADPAGGARCLVSVTRDVTEEERSRQQLAASAEFLQHTLDASSDAVFVTDAGDPDAPVRLVNRQMLELCGMAPGQAAGLTPQQITEAFTPLLFDAADELARVEQIDASGQTHESYLHLRDGRTLLRRCVPARIGPQALRIWSLRDVSAEQARLALEGELRAMLDTFPGQVVRASEDFRYEYANERFAALFGLRPEQIIGRHVGEVLGQERLAELRLRRERIVASGRPEVEERSIERPDGVRVDLLLTTFEVRPAHPGGRAKYYQVGVDISDRKRAEAQLRIASAQLERRSRELQDTLDSVAQGILRVDADGRVGVHNRRTLELLELPESLLGPDTHYDAIRAFQVERGDLGDDTGRLQFGAMHLGFDEVRSTTPEVYMRRTRSSATIEVRTRQLPDGAILRTYSDVTAYVDAQQALRSLLEAFPGSISAVDRDGTYRYVNARLAAVLGRPAHEIVGRHASELVGPERYAVIEQEFRRAVAGEPAVSERVYEVDGGRRQVHLEVSHVAGPLQPGGRQTIYAFGIDITARKRAEAALIEARDDAERANRAKSQFLSQMSHELRTPMNAILGFAQLLQSDSRHPLTGPQQTHVAEILNGARHLLELINEVLDLGRVETGQLLVERVAVPLDELITDCLAMMRPLAQSHGVDLLTPEGPALQGLVWADRTRLKQVLLNLLANAIKYNRPGGSVALVCSEQGERLRVNVMDTGPGLSAGEQQRLFQPFERLSAAGTDIEGTGIGLALSRRLAQAMGGEIGVHSTPGQGSCFWIELPRAQAESARPAGVAGTARPAGPARSASPGPLSASTVPTSGARSVLYIEDNPVNVVLMQAMLARLDGVRTLVAEAPLRGLARARDEQPDLVLLDIQLPGIDGFEVLRRLRADPLTQRIPVVAVSANAMQSDLDAGMAAGFAAYLTKPIELETLLATVVQLLYGSATDAAGTQSLV